MVELKEPFAKEKGFHVERDQVGNILIRKPATAGMENRKPVVLQAHLDMVPQKNNDTVHDFTKDPIQPYIDGEWVKARGTTLGADNGIGPHLMCYTQHCHTRLRQPNHRIQHLFHHLRIERRRWLIKQPSAIAGSDQDMWPSFVDGIWF